MTTPISSDSQIRDRLHSAVDDTTTPPAFAQIVMKGGRARRRRRYAAVTLVAAVVVTSGAVLLTPDSPLARDGQVAGGGRTNAAAMKWARSLPMGPAAQLPYFGEGGLHDGDQVVPLPDTVAPWMAAPQAVSGGWLVALDNEKELAPAVLGADGSLRPLPTYPFPENSNDSRMVVSPDGSRVAYGDRVVDLATLATTEIPHDPADEPIADPGYAQAIRLIGFTDEGLVYEGSPTTQGLGTAWLLRDDGSTDKIGVPEGSHISDGSPADIAISFDYSTEPDVCVTTYRLVANEWVEQPTQCLGHDIELRDISPDGHRLLTEDLSSVWDLHDGGFTAVDVPSRLPGNVGWESTDTFLIPVVDRRLVEYTIGEPVDQELQIVRCTVSTGECERAGDLQQFTVTGDVMGTSEVSFGQ